MPKQVQIKPNTLQGSKLWLENFWDWKISIHNRASSSTSVEQRAEERGNLFLVGGGCAHKATSLNECFPEKSGSV